MLRYKGILRGLISIAIIFSLIVGTGLLVHNKVDVYHCIKNLDSYRKNQKLLKEINSTNQLYIDSVNKIEQISLNIKKLGSLTDNDKNNFIGYVGENTKMFKLNVDDISFVNIKMYVSNLGTEKSEYDSLIEPILKENANNLGNRDSIVDISKNEQIDNEKKLTEETSPEELAKVAEIKRLADEAALKSANAGELTPDGVLINVNGVGEDIDRFISNLEKYYFKYFLVKMENKEDGSHLKLIIDLR